MNLLEIATNAAIKRLRLSGLVKEYFYLLLKPPTSICNQ